MRVSKRNGWGDRQFNALLLLITGCVMALLALIVLFLLYESWFLFVDSDQNGLMWSFFFGQSWYPLEGDFGLSPMILSTFVCTLGALFLALPVGLGCAIFLQFYATTPILNRSLRMVLNLLAGVPSVVFGLWGLTRLVPLMAHAVPPGTSLLAAILVLALMIVPTVTLTSSAALAAVPQTLIEGGLALGFRQHTRILKIIIPAARAGIISGALLAAARALGETMAVLMVAGNVVQNPSSLFKPVRVLTANIALEMSYAMGDHRASLFASGLLLTLLVGVLSWAVYRINQYTGEQHSHA